MRRVPMRRVPIRRKRDPAPACDHASHASKWKRLDGVQRGRRARNPVAVSISPHTGVGSRGVVPLFWFVLLTRRTLPRIAWNANRRSTCVITGVIGPCASRPGAARRRGRSSPSHAASRSGPRPRSWSGGHVRRRGCARPAPEQQNSARRVKPATCWSVVGQVARRSLGGAARVIDSCCGLGATTIDLCCYGHRS